MTYYKKNHKQSVKPATNKGFTIIETFFSILLILLALVFTAKMMECAFDAQRKSKVRFNMSQLSEIYKNRLLSKPFEAGALKEGRYTKQDGPFKMNWDIDDVSPHLKTVRFSISYKQLTKQSFFYISKYIKNGGKQ